MRRRSKMHIFMVLCKSFFASLSRDFTAAWENFHRYFQAFFVLNLLLKFTKKNFLAEKIAYKNKKKKQGQSEMTWLRAKIFRLYKTRKSFCRLEENIIFNNSKLEESGDFCNPRHEAKITWNCQKFWKLQELSRLWLVRFKDVEGFESARLSTKKSSKFITISKLSSLFILS